MSHYSEQDPLLPKDKGAPEIHDSRPQSISDVTVQEVLEKDEDMPRRHSFGSLMPVILGLCLVLSFAFLFLSKDTLGDERPAPRTIEQRVSKILTNTPLIGLSYLYNIRCFF